MMRDPTRFNQFLAIIAGPGTHELWMLFDVPSADNEFVFLANECVNGVRGDIVSPSASPTELYSPTPRC
jgi:hypothetical protein